MTDTDTRLIWDFNKTNDDLHLEHGVARENIARARKALQIGRTKLARMDCSGWDWSLPNSELARMHGLSIGNIAMLRFKFDAPDPIKRRRAREIVAIPPASRGTFDFTAVDWSIHDAAIAKQFGCSREWVRQKRIQKGLSPKHKTQLLYERFIEWAKQQSEITSRSFEEFGICPQTGRKYCAKAGIPVKALAKPCKHPWHLMNWQLADGTLCSIWRIGLSGLFSSHRSLKGRPGAIYKYVKGSLPEPPQELLDAEKAKADEWRLNGGLK